jgi:hypothetical protein
MPARGRVLASPAGRRETSPLKRFGTFSWLDCQGWSRSSTETDRSSGSTTRCGAGSGPRDVPELPPGLDAEWRSLCERASDYWPGSGEVHLLTERKLAEERLARGLEEFLEVTGAVSEGDLTRRGRPGPDTLGRIAAETNTTLDRIGQMLVKVRSMAESVSTTAAEIPAASAEQMARSIEKVASGAQLAAERAQQAEETAR